jgi:GNAT superfamily N-acetyltransferase
VTVWLVLLDLTDDGFQRWWAAARPVEIRGGSPAGDEVIGGACEDGTVRIDMVAYDHPDAVRLVAEVQREYEVRYGGPDTTPVTPAEFAPPWGVFLVGYSGDLPVACGGWRAHGTDAEAKRMYVAQAARRTGLARSVLAELERTALAAGRRRMVLETGSEQPEAVALYHSAGYNEIAAFGRYACSPRSIHLGKLLRPG